MKKIIELIACVFLLLGCNQSSEKKNKESIETGVDGIDSNSATNTSVETIGEITIEKNMNLVTQYLIYPDGDTGHILIQDNKGKVIKNEGNYGHHYLAAVNKKDGSQELRVIIYSVSIDSLDKALGLFEYKSKDDHRPEMVEGFHLTGNADTMTFTFSKYKSERLLSLKMLFYDKGGNQDEQVFDHSFSQGLIKWAPKDYINKDYFTYLKENKSK